MLNFIYSVKYLRRLFLNSPLPSLVLTFLSYSTCTTRAPKIGKSLNSLDVCLCDYALSKVGKIVEYNRKLCEYRVSI